jgi:hypothetical protein
MKWRMKEPVDMEEREDASVEVRQGLGVPRKR